MSLWKLSTFMLDIVLIFVDVLSVIVSAEMEAKLFKLSRVAKITRLLRLLRVMKGMQIAEILQQQ